MDAKERLKSELRALVKEFHDVQDACSWGTNEVMLFGLKYQTWYTKALKVVEVLAPDRMAEFTSLYHADSKRKHLTGENYAIQDFVRGLLPYTSPYEDPPFDVSNVTKVRLYNQQQILIALNSRIDGVLADVEGFLLAALEDDELVAADRLVKVNRRSAGALAGVVLERHLQRVAANHQVKIGKKNATIADLNDPLRNAGLYDVPTWRKIQHLADLRNLCSHQKDREPTDPEVLELIAGVKSVVSTIA